MTRKHLDMSALIALAGVFATPNHVEQAMPFTRPVSKPLAKNTRPKRKMPQPKEGKAKN